MQKSKKTDRNTHLTNIGSGVQRLTANAELYAKNAGVSDAALQAACFEAELDRLFKKQEGLNAQLLPDEKTTQLRTQFAAAMKEHEDIALRSARLAESAKSFIEVPKSSVTHFYSGRRSSSPSFNQYPPQKPRRSLSPSFEAVPQRRIIETSSKHFTPRYASHQAQGIPISNREIEMVLGLLLAIFLLYATAQWMQNSSVPTFKP